MKKYAFALAIIWIVAAAAVFVDLSATGGIRVDNIVEQDINAIKNTVTNFSYAKKRLPDSLNEVTINDSNTKNRLNQYEYHKLAYDKYELCATFKTASKQKNNTFGGYTKDYIRPEVHQAGHQCFSQKEYIDPPKTQIQVSPKSSTAKPALN